MKPWLHTGGEKGEGLGGEEGTQARQRVEERAREDTHLVLFRMPRIPRLAVSYYSQAARALTAQESIKTAPLHTKPASLFKLVRLAVEGVGGSEWGW